METQAHCNELAYANKFIVICIIRLSSLLSLSPSLRIFVPVIFFFRHSGDYKNHDFFTMGIFRCGIYTYRIFVAKKASNRAKSLLFHTFFAMKIRCIISWLMFIMNSPDFTAQIRWELTDCNESKVAFERCSACSEGLFGTVLATCFVRQLFLCFVRFRASGPCSVRVLFG